MCLARLFSFVLFCFDDLNDGIESMFVKLVGCSELGGTTENQLWSCR